MRIFKYIFLVIALLSSSIVFADPASTKEAEKLLEAMDMDKSLDQAIVKMIDIQLQQNPQLTPYKGVMVKFFRKHMSYESLKPDLIRVYSKAFTAEELKEIKAFYLTDVGKKTIRVMPELMVEGSQIGAKRVQDNMGELRSMIEAEMKRIEKEGK